ncbi:MAG: hypothetical protein AB7O96_09130 [Pseudobdellovibrionaceae bacterium]
MNTPRIPNTNDFDPMEKEDSQDASDILTDKDETLMGNPINDSQMSQKLTSLESLEDEPEEFDRGEIDVKEQMDRTARAVEDVVNKKQLHTTPHTRTI